MNERTQELAREAGFCANPDIEKFAELIVKECVSITDELVNRSVDGTWASDELYTDYNGALFEVKRRIEEYFGVE